MSTFPPSVADLPALTPFSQQDILDLFDRILPQHYLAPLKDPGPGYEYLQGVAKLTARVSEAIAHIGTGNYVLTATGGSFATATVEFFRTTAIYGPITVLAGTRVRTEEGFVYITQANAVFGAGDLGPHAVTVRSLQKSWLYNIAGPFTRPNGEVVPGAINKISAPLMNPPFGDPTMQVRQTTNATGGMAAMLDALGQDKGIARQPGETDDQYRPRIVFLPQTVTPNALEGATADFLRPLLEPLGLTYAYFETWSARYQTAYDFPANITLTDPYTLSPPPPGSTFNGNVFVYDDPRPLPWVSNRYLDDNDYRGAIAIFVPKLPCVADFGMAFDLTLMNANAFKTPVGALGLTSYDVPSSGIPASVLEGAFDGADLQQQALYGGLGAVLEKIKAAGVYIEILGV